MRDIGFNAVKPYINSVSFRKADYITLNMADGRIVSLPLVRFPGIMRLTSAQRRLYHIADGEIILFQDDDEVYHIQDFLGTYETNAYGPPAKRISRRSFAGIDSTVNTDGRKFTIVPVKKNKNVVADTQPL